MPGFLIFRSTAVLTVKEQQKLLQCGTSGSLDPTHCMKTPALAFSMDLGSFSNFSLSSDHRKTFLFLPYKYSLGSMGFPPGARILTP